ASGQVSMWKVPSLQPIGDLRGHDQSALTLAWHPSRSELATGGQDGVVRLWGFDSVVERAVLPVAERGSWVEHLAWSPDGRFLACDLMAPTGDRDVWVLDLKRELRQRLTQAKAGTREWVPSWTPDSKRVVFSANRKGRANDGEFYVRSADGTGSDEVLLDSDLRKHHSQISMDGSLLAFDGGAATNTDIYLVELNGSDRTPRPFLASSFSEGQPQFSPDGKLLAYVAADTGNLEVYVHTVKGKAQRWRISKSGGVSPRWKNDGKEIVYLAADGYIVSVPVKGTGESFEPGAGTNLFLTRILGLASTTHFAMSPDAQRILLPAANMQPDWPLTVTVNWGAPKQ
ncbi:MAG: PD40 domain-containing protein, partial [Bryobacterales bacterium]|nr:PD40 domain-containing protein [Bryobacterales bacterium]